MSRVRSTGVRPGGGDAAGFLDNDLVGGVLAGGGIEEVAALDGTDGVHMHVIGHVNSARACSTTVSFLEDIGAAMKRCASLVGAPDLAGALA